MGRKIAGTANVRQGNATKKSFCKSTSRLTYLFNDASRPDENAEKIRLWNRFIPLTPTEASKILLRDLPEETTIELDFDELGEGTIQFYARDIFNDNGSFDLEDKTLDAGIIRVKDDEKGKGYGRTLFRNQVEFFYNCGVRKFEISAGLDNGGYTWARVGFLPDDVKDESFKSYVVSPVRKTFKLLAPLLKDDERKKIEKHIGFKKRDDIWHIADADIDLGKRLTSAFNEAADSKKAVMVENLRRHFSADVFDYIKEQVENGGSIKIGRLLLTGTSWEGSLDMNNVRQMRRMADYTGGFDYITFKP